MCLKPRITSAITLHQHCPQGYRGSRSKELQTQSSCCPVNYYPSLVPHDSRSHFLFRDVDRNLVPHHEINNQLLNFRLSSRSLCTSSLRYLPQHHPSPYDADGGWKLKVRRKLGLLAISKDHIRFSSRGLYEACTDKIKVHLFFKG